MTANLATTPTRTPSLFELFQSFASISLSGFGSVLPWARRMIVERRRWMTAEEFNAAFALCQFLPGPNIVNFSVIYGSRIHGVAGAFAALLGLIGPPIVLMIGIGAMYLRFGDTDAVRRVLTGVAAAAAGLVIANVVKMAEPLVRGGLSPAPFVALAGFVAVGVMRWPLPLVLAVLLPVSVALAWRSRRR